jgi:hypothetical protein
MTTIVLEMEKVRIGFDFNVLSFCGNLLRVQHERYLIISLHCVDVKDRPQKDDDSKDVLLD